MSSRLYLLLLLALAACHRTAPRPEKEPPDRPPRPVDVEAVLGGEPEAPPLAWPLTVEDLPTSLRAFRDEATCVRSLRASMPTVLSEAVSDIGYHPLLEHLCASLRAVKEGNEAGCRALAISPIERGCLRRLALVHGRPEACPNDRVLPGREPTCLAWAQRDRGLCRAAPTTERILCQAVFAADEKACAGESASGRARCEALVARYGPALGDKRRESAAEELEPTFVSEVSRADADGEGPRERQDSKRSLAEGVHLAASGCAFTVELGHKPTAGARGLYLRLEIPSHVTLPFEHAFDVAGTSFSIGMPDGLSLNAVGSEGRVVLEAFRPEYGAELRGTFDATATHLGTPYHVEGRFTTFIRDFERLPEHCPLSTPPR